MVSRADLEAIAQAFGVAPEAIDNAPTLGKALEGNSKPPLTVAGAAALMRESAENMAREELAGALPDSFRVSVSERLRVLVNSSVDSRSLSVSLILDGQEVGTATFSVGD